MRIFKVLISTLGIVLVVRIGFCEEIGNRIAYFAESFLGKSYDPDPLGSYVRNKVIVYDEKVDCMYLVFRSVELAISTNFPQSIEVALDKRFRTKGIISNGIVLNYEERFEYGEDMVMSGKFGLDITRSLSQRLAYISSSRIPNFEFIPKSEVHNILSKLKNGDIVYFIKNPKDRKVDEIVGHMGIIKVENGKVFLIHASGKKTLNYTKSSSTGKVKKVPFLKYVLNSRFIGLKVTRL